MEILAYITALGIGLLLGLVGGGGSIITVPVFVYLLGFSPLLATTCSLFVVGVTSLFGGLKAYQKGLVDFKVVTEFGLPSILSIYLTRHFLVPALPEHFFRLGNVMITREIFLMLLFAILMLLAAAVMLFGKQHEKSIPVKNSIIPGINKTLLQITFGLLLGIITGLLGAGGGFLIIPVLTFLIGMGMKEAVGTSLIIISINTLFGFIFSLSHFSFNWMVLITFTAIAVAGIYIGGRISDKISAIFLKKLFGWFILAVGSFIVIKELWLH